MSLARYNLGMRRFYPALRHLLAVVTIPLFISAVLGTCMGGLAFEVASCSLQHDVLRSLFTYGHGALLFFLLLLALTLDARRDFLAHQASEQFSLLKPAKDLRPEDFGYEVATPSTEIDPGRRPYYGAYVPRTATAQSSTVPSLHSYDETALEQELRQGSGFVLQQAIWRAACRAF